MANAKPMMFPPVMLDQDSGPTWSMSADEHGDRRYLIPREAHCYVENGDAEWQTMIRDHRLTPASQ